MWITILDICNTIWYNKYMKENKTEFVIIRVTKVEKSKLLRLAKKAKQKFSNFIRLTLGL